MGHATLPMSSIVASLALITVASVAGCAAATDASSDEADPGTTSEELSSRAPLPYVLQFVGTYENAAAPSGKLRKLVLSRTGRYTAWTAGKTTAERGAFYGVSHLSDPKLETLRMVTKGLAWSVKIEGYTGALTVTRAGVTSKVAATGIVGPNESICDDSLGSWTDDDADARTGLYCVCPAPKSYIPSAGGCVR
jgi:hypothetical protein